MSAASKTEQPCRSIAEALRPRRPGGKHFLARCPAHAGELEADRSPGGCDAPLRCQVERLEAVDVVGRDDRREDFDLTAEREAMAESVW